MSALATSLVNWNAVGKIVLAGLVGGVGVVIVFGLGVYAVERFEAAKTIAGKVLNAVFVGAAGAFCIGAIVVGIIAMANPSHGSSSSKKSEKKAAISVQRTD